MEITINIPKNNYVQPNEVRQNVVQLCCDAMLNMIKMKRELAIRKDTMRVCVGKNGYAMWGLDARERDIQVRTCELRAAFDAMQDAGYYIYVTLMSYPREYRFTFSEKPFFEGRKAERVDFNLFID